MKKMPEGQPFYRGHYAIKPERRVVMIIFALCASPEAMLYLYQKQLQGTGNTRHTSKNQLFDVSYRRGKLISHSQNSHLKLYSISFTISITVYVLSMSHIVTKKKYTISIQVKINCLHFLSKKLGFSQIDPIE